MTSSTRASWDTYGYARIVDAIYRDGKLPVQFEDGTCASVDPKRVLPPDTPPANWARVSVSPYDLAVPTEYGHVEVPWDVIRVHTDPAYSAHLAHMAEKEAVQIGVRIRELREGRHLTARELAARAGISPQLLSRIEHGRHEVVFDMLDRVLGAMGCTLHDLIIKPDDDSESESAS